MLLYVLICILAALALLIAPALLPKHPPTRARRRCRCGAKADVIDPTWPWRTWCAGCKVKRLLKDGETL